jgi:hypothetical protein
MHIPLIMGTTRQLVCARTITPLLKIKRNIERFISCHKFFFRSFAGVMQVIRLNINTLREAKRPVLREYLVPALACWSEINDGVINTEIRYASLQHNSDNVGNMSLLIR